MIYTKAKRDDSNGTSLMGYVKCSYQHLIKRLGQPHLNCKVDSLDSKIDVEWIFKFKDGTVSTLYNYKTGPNYLGSDGTQVEQMTIWHVGGFNDKSVIKIAKALKVDWSKNRHTLYTDALSSLKPIKLEELEDDHVFVSVVKKRKSIIPEDEYQSYKNDFNKEILGKSELKTFRFTRTETIVDYQTVEASTLEEAENKLKLENWQDEEVLSSDTESREL